MAYGKDGGMNQILNFIGNDWVEPSSRQFLPNVNPATAEALPAIPDSDDRDIELAVRAARGAQPSWSKKSPQERAEVLFRIADLFEQQMQDFAELESRDQGKPVALALRMDMARVAQNFRFFAAEILTTKEESTATDQQTLNYVHRRPLGVVGLISPWNLPLYLLTWKIAPAIAYGNTVICKPSEFTSLTAAKFAEILLAAKTPTGVVNIVFGYGHKAGAALVRHSEVAGISFTGGTETGRKIFADSAADFKKLSLELGGKNPTVVFADADIEAAVAGVVRSGFLNQGEICLCGSRVYVEKNITGEFTKKLLAEVKKLKVGDPSAPDTFMGPLISKSHFEKVLSYVNLANKEDGKILTGGKPADVGGPFKNGFFFEPTIISGLPESSRCIQEEIFGPVITISEFSSMEEVLQKANGVRYGLSASIWTSSLNKAHSLAHSIQAGTVWINSWLVRDLRMPFGGMKHSGLGREGGGYSKEFFTEATTVSLRLNPFSTTQEVKP